MSAWALRLLRDLRGLAGRRQDKCRAVRAAPTVSLVELQDRATGDARLVVRGVATCGSVHSCPACAEVILRHRADEVSRAVETWGRDRVGMLTLTIRHQGWESLAVLQRVLALAYQELKAGRPGKRMRAELGWVGDIRAAEQTHGAHGWHPHLHALWFFEGGQPTEAAMSMLKERWAQTVERVCRRLCRAVERAIDGHAPSSLPALLGACLYNRDWSRLLAELEAIAPEPDLEHGVKLTPVLEAGYISKLGLEIAGARKTGRSEGQRSSWEIAVDAASGDDRSRRLWSEHFVAMRGRRQLTWSRGLRDLLSLGEELSDEQLASERPVDDADERELATVEGAAWDKRSQELQQEWPARILDAYAEQALSSLACVDCHGEIDERSYYRDRPLRIRAGPDLEYADQRGKALGKELCAPRPIRGERYRYLPREERELILEEARHRLMDAGVLPRKVRPRRMVALSGAGYSSDKRAQVE